MSEIPLAQLGDFLVLFWDLLFFSPFIGFCWFFNMLIMCRDLLGQSWRLFRWIFSFSLFGVTAISLFLQYWDSLYFSRHLLSFYAFSSISALLLFFVFHQVFIMQEIQLAEPVWFFMCSEICCFPLHSSGFVDSSRCREYTEIY